MLRDVDTKILTKGAASFREVQQAEREKDKPLLFPFRFTFLQNKTFSLVWKKMNGHAHAMPHSVRAIRGQLSLWVKYYKRTSKVGK